MNTQIVYVIISKDTDIYVEQAYMSIWSCKKYNQDAKIIVVCDKETLPQIKAYSELNKLIHDIQLYDFNDEISNMERSRILKTKLRELVEGDFLFVDTDTIFYDSINEIDNISDNIALVEDIHAEAIESHPYKNGISKKYANLYGSIPPKDSVYYNSGIIFCKDSQVSHDIYKKWHDNWSFSKNKPGGMFDQPSLLKTVIENPSAVKTLKPYFNAQIIGSIKYLHSAKIIHFFNANWGNKSVHPFFDKEYYRNIKKVGRLTDQVKSDILDSKNLFSSPTFIIGPESVPFWISVPCIILKRINSHKVLRGITSIYLRTINRIFKLS